MRSRFPFERVSPDERREAERFFAELYGRGQPRARRPVARPSPALDRAESADGESFASIARMAREAAESVLCKRHDGRPTVFEAICWGEAYFEFVGITTSFKNSTGEYHGRFWVLDDALKWIVPERFSIFVESYDPMTAKVKNWTRSPSRRRNWRLPCTPEGAQEAAAVVKMGQADLPGARATSSSTERLGSLLLTPKLYDERYRQADLKIAPQTVDGRVGLMEINKRKGLTFASNRYNTLVNEAAHRISQADPAPRRMLADPGKIWVLTNTAGNTYKSYTTPAGQPSCRPDPAGTRATPNYGWHRSPTNIRDVIQNPGNCHGKGHIDYSQIFMVVAGWCEVTRPGQSAPTWVRTAEVYQSDELHKLATYEGKLRKIRYDWL
jgi:hypothetical protein